MRPSFVMLSIVLHGTAMFAVLRLGSGEVGAAPRPPAHVEIQTTQASVPTPPPVPEVPVHAESAQVPPLTVEPVIEDVVEAAEVASETMAEPAPDLEPVRTAADRLPRTAMAKVLPPRHRPQADAAAPDEVDPIAVEVAESAPAEPQAAAPSAPPQEYVEAQRADNTPPRYPERERRLGHEGEVVLRVAVDADGAVVDVVVQEASRYEAFNREALRAAREWRFEPALEHGVAVASETVITVEFRLSSP